MKLDDNNFDESELVSLKVPAGYLSYYNSSRQFVRVDGQIEIGGVQYNFVKRRLFNDSIEMLCIPNHSATHLNKVKNDFFKLVNDLQQPGQDKKTDSHSSKNYSGDDYIVIDPFNINKLLYIVAGKAFDRPEKLPSIPTLSCERPPQKTA